jgi:hypothetical protein
MTLRVHRSPSIGAERVLVVGVYLADQENTVAHVVPELARSVDWDVYQRWIAVGHTPAAGEVAAVTISRVESLVPKFTLLNQALAAVPLADYAYVLVCDDDILLPPGFLDEYLGLVCQHGFALCQPARTHDSYIDHSFVEQLDGLSARRTRFVEIGPLFSIRRDATSLMLPFDEHSPMGWGYDLVWPCVLESAGLSLGIIDRVPVAHSVRRPVALYDHHTADRQMEGYLEGRQHLSLDDAFLIVEAYA